MPIITCGINVEGFEEICPWVEAIIDAQPKTRPMSDLRLVELAKEEGMDEIAVAEFAKRLVEQKILVRGRKKTTAKPGNSNAGAVSEGTALGVELKGPDIFRIADIHLDGQVRTGLDKENLAGLKDEISCGESLPEIVICKRPEGELLLVDGYHRFEIIKESLQGKPDEEQVIRAKWFEGSRFTALAYGFKANSHHGKRLTMEDRVHAYIQIINTPEGKEFTDQQLADVLGVTRMSINRYKNAARNPNPVPQREKVTKSPVETTVEALSKLAKRDCWLDALKQFVSKLEVDERRELAQLFADE